MQHQCPRRDTGTSTLVVYLGCQFISDARCDKEIRRIGIAKSAFTSMRKVLTSRDIYIYDSSHQSAEMLCVVNIAIWMRDMDNFCGYAETNKSIRNMALQKNVEKILKGHGYQ